MIGTIGWKTIYVKWKSGYNYGWKDSRGQGGWREPDSDMKSIQARIVATDDIGARRMSAAENLQREDLAIIETIEAIVAIIDAELIDDAEYNSMGKHPVERVEALLGKLHSIANSKDRGSQVFREGELLLDKFVQQLEKIFKRLPKPLEWR